MTPLPKKSYRHQLGPMIHLSTTQKFDPLLLINLENIKVGQISFLNVATFKSAQVPWTYFLKIECRYYIFVSALTGTLKIIHVSFRFWYFGKGHVLKTIFRQNVSCWFEK